jgi:hypothetical protein
LAAPDDFAALICLAGERVLFATLLFLAGARFFATARFVAAVRFVAAGRFAAAVRFFAAALRTGRLLAAALVRAPNRRLLAAVRLEVRLAAFFAGTRAALRADRFTDFLAAVFFLAAMLASAREETGCPR